MTRGDIFRRFASDPDLAPLLAEKEMAFLQYQPQNESPTRNELQTIIALCERIGKALDEHGEMLEVYEEELVELGEEMERVG